MTKEMLGMSAGVFVALLATIVGVDVWRGGEGAIGPRELGIAALGAMLFLSTLRSSADEKRARATRGAQRAPVNRLVVHRRVRSQETFSVPPAR